MTSRLRQRMASDSGLGLVEVMVAMGLLTVLLTSVAFTLTRQMTMQRDSKAREGALDVAAQAIDRARGSKDFSALTASSWTDTMNGETYTVQQTVTTYLQNSSGSPCDGTGSSSVAYKSINVAVTWSGMANVLGPVRSQTLLSPSVTSYDPTLGNVAVKVKDGLGQPVEGVQVVTTGPSGTRTTFSDGAGCAFVEQLTPGTYTSTASLAGFVTPDGQTAPSKSVTVQAAQTVAMAFELGATATITVTLPNREYAPVTSVPITLGNNSLLPSGRLTIAGSGATRVLTSRYPYQSGYTVWTGSCDDADPEGSLPVDLTLPAGSPYTDVASAANAGRYHPADSRGSAVPALPVPNVNAPVQVAMSSVNVLVLNAAGQPIPGTAVTMTHVGLDPAAGNAFPGCPAGETYTLGTTDASGQLKVSTPYGYWAITSAAPGSVPTRSWLHPDPDAVTITVRAS